MSFANVRNNTILDFNTKYLDKDIVRVVTSDEIYQAYKEDRNKVIYQDGEIILDPEYEAKQTLKEKERIQELSMTRSDFFDGMIMAFNLGSKELRDIIEQVLNNINITPVEVKVALNNYDNALNFYRKHPLFTLLNNVPIEASGVILIFTSDIWDKFFDTRDYKELQKAIQVETKHTDSDNEVADMGE